VKKFWAIASAILAIGGILFAYGRRYLGRLTFDVDIVLNLSNISLTQFTAPLQIEIDNKNTKSITVKNLNIKVFSDKNILLAETETIINTYKIEGLKNNIFRHNFIVYMTDELVKIVKAQYDGKTVDVYLIASFDIFGFIPITVREELQI
jgi:hypothetical protein